MLLRVRASDGKLLESDEHAYPGGGECTALELRPELGFRVQRRREPNRAVRIRAAAAHAARAHVQRRALRRGQRQWLVGDSRLLRRSQRGSAGQLLHRRKIRRHSARSACAAISGVERVVALADGRVAVIVPPRLGAAGFLSLIDARGRRATHPAASCRRPRRPRCSRRDSGSTVS